MGKTKSKTSQEWNSTSTSNPADWAMPDFQEGMGMLRDARNSGKGGNVYQGQRVIDQLGDQTQAGQGQIGQAADDYFNLTNESQKALQRIAVGADNPYFKQNLANQLDSARDMLGNAGSYQGMASGGQNPAMARELGKIATNAYSNQFNQGIQNQIAASGELSNQAKTRAGLGAAQMQAGGVSDDLRQLQLDAEREKWNDEEMAPWKRLGLYTQGLRGLCFARGTKVMMADGSHREIQDIVEGDKLLGYNGETRLVLATHRHKDHTFYVYPVKDYANGYTVSANHRIVLKKNHERMSGDDKQKYYQDNGLTYISADEFYRKGKTFKRMHGFILQKFEGEEKELPVDPYYFGIWLGDGCSREPNCIYNIDKPIIEWLHNFGLKTTADRKDVYEFGIRHTAESSLKDKFRKLSIYCGINEKTGREVFEKRIPEEYLTSSFKQRMQVLAGIIDTDGYTSSNETGYSITQSIKREGLIFDIRRIASSLGLMTALSYRVSPQSEKVKNSSPQCTISIHGIGVEKIPTLKHKTRDPLYVMGNRMDAEYKGVDDVFGITLDGDHLMVLGNGMVSHNSDGYGKNTSSGRSEGRSEQGRDALGNIAGGIGMGLGALSGLGSMGMFGGMGGMGMGGLGFGGMQMNPFLNQRFGGMTGLF